MQQDILRIFNTAIELHQKGQSSDAKILYSKILSLDPRHFGSLHNSGLLALNEGNISLAIGNIERALEINPQSPYACANLGNAYKADGRMADARRAYEHALFLKPDFAGAYSNLGALLSESGHPEQAIALLQRALQLQPEDATAAFNYAKVQQNLQNSDLATQLYERTLRLNPNFPEAYKNLASIYTQRKDDQKAYTCLQKLAKFPKHRAEALVEMAKICVRRRHAERAIQICQEVLQLNRNLSYLHGLFLQAKLQINDWEGVHALLQEIDALLINGKETIDPFTFLVISDDARKQKLCAEIYARQYSIHLTEPSKPSQTKNKKISIAYYSSDLRNHPMMTLIAEMLERHSRQEFSVTLLYLGPKTDDYWHQRAVRAADTFIDVSEWTEADIVKYSKSQGIDIAIDLNGYTDMAKAGIFASRAAPIQVNFIGFPGTLSLKEMDYIIADEYLIDAQHRDCYGESIAYIPNCYLPNCELLPESDKIPSRQDFNLPQDDFVFCCFNNNHKILPETFDIWMNLLKKLERSIFWIYCSNDLAQKNLIAEAEVRGISGDRIRFAGTVSREEHLARFTLADLFLDTFPYNAHTTASEALRMGLPVLTMSGESFASRVAGSLLTTMGVSELITRNPLHYEQLAFELASDRAKLSSLKSKIKQNLRTTPLFNSQLFTKNLERLYKEMLKRHHSGLKPDVIKLSQGSSSPKNAL